MTDLATVGKNDFVILSLQGKYRYCSLQSMYLSLLRVSVNEHVRDSLLHQTLTFRHRERTFRCQAAPPFDRFVHDMHGNLRAIMTLFEAKEETMILGVGTSVKHGARIHFGSF